MHSSSHQPPRSPIPGIVDLMIKCSLTVVDMPAITSGPDKFLVVMKLCFQRDFVHKIRTSTYRLVDLVPGSLVLELAQTTQLKINLPSNWEQPLQLLAPGILAVSCPPSPKFLATTVPCESSPKQYGLPIFLLLFHLLHNFTKQK